MKPQSITRTFVTLNVVNDFAYFGFLVIQFYLLEDVLGYILPKDLSAESFAVSVIVSQLIWQIWAEGPTGAFADAYGRARAVAASYFCRVAGIGLILVAIFLAHQGMNPVVLVLVATMLVASQMLIATGEAFLEGSIEAWLRDEMEVVSPTDFAARVDRAFGLSAIAQNIGILAAYAVFLGMWQITKGMVGFGLACAAGIFFWVGGGIANHTARGEQFVRIDSQRRSFRGIIHTIRDAIKALLYGEAPEVRRVAVVLVLPFPCWILLSWFFPAFVNRTGMQGGLPLEVLPWLGLSLGIARVLGAWWGNKVTMLNAKHKLSSLFEKAVVVNVLFLFLGGALLVIADFGYLSIPSALLGSMFVLLAASAKGSEEVVKLAKNRLLAVVVSDASDRATILSLISICQNAFAFTALCLAGLLVLPVRLSSGGNVILMFCICGILGLLAALFVRAGRNSTVTSGNGT